MLGGYGILDYDDSVTLYLENLIPHSTMTVEFDFVKIDSWDAETAYFYVRRRPVLVEMSRCTTVDSGVYSNMATRVVSRFLSCWVLLGRRQSRVVPGVFWNNRGPAVWV